MSLSVLVLGGCKKTTKRKTLGGLINNQLID